MACASASTATSGGAKSASPAPTSITSTPCCTSRRLIAGISAIGYVGSAAKRLLNGVTMSPLRRIYAPLVQRVTGLYWPLTGLYHPCVRPDAVSRKELLAGDPHIRPMAHQSCGRG